MKVKVVGVDNSSKGEIELPKQFGEDIRADLIKRAVLVLQSKKRQTYGAKPKAGKRAQGDLSRRRHDFKGSYGFGISRVPRKIVSGKGTRWNWVGAVAPGTVGGRRAHPPKPEKLWEQKINKKEMSKAIRSAIAATVSLDVVKKGGHNVPKDYPIVFESSIESIDKLNKVKGFFEAVGLKEELSRVKEKGIRSGRGKSRGRKYKKKKGPLVVVSKECKLSKATRNIAGVEVVNVGSINAELLAPGAVPGRITLWSKGAIEKIGKDGLFLR